MRSGVQPFGRTLTNSTRYGCVGITLSLAIVGSWVSKARFCVTTSPGAAARTVAGSVASPYQKLTTASPGSVTGTYWRFACSVSLARPVSPNDRLATAASTAATEGALRERWRARSRAAIRSDVGRRLPSRPTTARITGTRRSVPMMRTTAPTVTANSPPMSRPTIVGMLGSPAAPVEPRTATAPRAVRITPAARTTRLGRADTLWPRMTPTMSRRPSRRAGTRAAARVLATAQHVMPTSRPHRTSRGPPRPKPPPRDVHAATPVAARTPRAVPTSAEKVPRTMAWASTVRRRTGVLAPLLAARARVRRWRAALTANAGPTSRAVVTRSMAAPSPTSRPIWLASPRATSCSSGASCSMEGGSRSTAAEVTRRPYSLSAVTSSQVTGSAPRTIQPPEAWVRPAGGIGTTSPSLPNPPNESAVPTMS